MDNNPETPSEGMEQARAETPQTEGTPTVDMSGSYSPTPAPSDAGSRQPEQYSSSAPGSSGEAGAMPPTPPPPDYSPGPPQQVAPPPQYDYQNPPQQGQPTQYMPPQQYASPSYPQSSPPPVPLQNQPPNYNPGDYGVNRPQQITGYGVAQPKDPMVGLLLELIGYVGFLGIGHIWAGKTTRGIALMVGYWIYLALSGVLTIVLIGCVMLVAALAIPIASGLYLKNEMEKEQAAMGIRR